VLGISYPTLKQWIYKNKIRTIKTAGGHHRIPEPEIDKYLFRASQGREVPERRTDFRRDLERALVANLSGGNGSRGAIALYENSF
jgi:excisionase family DNA binding protein